MGAKYSYYRKSPSANCYVREMSKQPGELKTLINSRYRTPCPCTEQDYECDEGFKRAEEDSELCIAIAPRSDDELHKAQKECALHDYFY